MAENPLFEDVVAQHGPLVWRVCRALLGPADAEEAWSETFLAALAAYPRLRSGSNVAGWLVTIAHRKAIDQHRAAARRPALTDSAESSAAGARAAGGVVPEDGMQSGDIDDRLREAIESLPPKQRGAVVYRYLADLSYAEIGALLDCSEPAARRSASEGIATLRRLVPRGVAT